VKYKSILLLIVKKFVYVEINDYYYIIMKRLKIILWLVGILSILVFLIRCKIQSNIICDVCSEVNIVKIPYSDTIVTESLHFHLEEEHLCCWVPKDTNVYSDTLYIELHYDR